MIDISTYAYAVFDCDGVILDSNHLKTAAYARSLDGEPDELVKRLLAYHAENAGISRYHKFRYFYERLHRVDNVEARINAALARFADIVHSEMIRCAYVPGVLSFIESARVAGVRMFVSSGSDEKELKDVFEKRGIAHFFEEILGSPTPKVDNTLRIADKMGRSKKGVFFGDARADAEAAHTAGLDFVFVKGTSTWENGEVSARESGAHVMIDFNEAILK